MFSMAQNPCERRIAAMLQFGHARFDVFRFNAFASSSPGEWQLESFRRLR
jgi:hypothetical protein